MSRAAAENVLSPYIPTLRSCILDAWQQFLTVQYRHEYERRTKSGIVRDLIVANVKTKFSTISGAKLITANRMFFLKIGNYLIRFKKLDENRMTTNYPTTQAKALEKQQLEIPEFENHVIVNAGYITDMLGTKVVSAALTLRNGNANEWEIMLGGAEHGFTVLPVQQQIDDEIFVRPRKELIDKEASSEQRQSKL